MKQTINVIETPKYLQIRAFEPEKKLKQTSKPLRFEDKLIFMRKRK